MAENKAPYIKPIKHREYECKQSKYDHVPKLPMRSLILSPSGGRQDGILTEYDFKNRIRKRLGKMEMKLVDLVGNALNKLINFLI